MTFLSLLIILVVIGVALYLIPMEERIKSLIITVIQVVVVVILILWLASAFGVRIPGAARFIN
jgi:hypothetical protein